MTGSDNCDTVNRRPTLSQQQECKSEGVSPADKLRRRAMKNSHDTKSSSPSPSSSSGESSSSSNSTSNQLPSFIVECPPNPAVEVGKIESAIISPVNKKKDQSSSDGPLKKPLCSTEKKDLLQSLKQTSSSCGSSSMRMLTHGHMTTTPTLCKGTSSYIYHCPRNLTHRKNTRSRPLHPNSKSTVLPGFIPASYNLLVEEDSCSDETQSMIEICHSKPLYPENPTLEASCWENELTLVSRQRSQRHKTRRDPLGLEFPTAANSRHQIFDTGSSRRNLQESYCSQMYNSHTDHTTLSCEKLLSGHHSKISSFQHTTAKSQSHMSIPQYGVGGCRTPCPRPQQHSNIAFMRSASCSHPRLLHPAANIRDSTLPNHRSSRLQQSGVLTDKKVKLHVPQGKKTASFI